jgi:hypothetical protein
MLRILLIILVALAVIIGLMRLTGAKSGDAAPPAAVAEEPAAEAAEPTVEDVIDEPAVDTLDAPAGVDGETTTEILDPAVEAVEGSAADVVETLEEVPAAVEPAPENAAPPADPEPVIEERAPAGDPVPPGR